MCVPAPRDRHTMQTAADDEAYLAAHGVQAAIKEALLRVVRERPADPVTSIGALLSGQNALPASAPPKAASATPTLASAPAAPAMPAAPAAPAVSGGSQKETDAAATIAGYLKCMSTKLKVSGKGEQNCEMLMVSRTGGALSVEDYGGWALRNESITRMVRELDASGALPDFAPALIQTGDRCVARRTASGAPELHLWQSQPVPEELRRRIPLTVLDVRHAQVRRRRRPRLVLRHVARGRRPPASTTPRAAASPPPARRRPRGRALGWCGTAHHHPSRLRLVALGEECPGRLAINSVADRAVDGQSDAAGAARHMTLEEQAGTFGYLLDIQGKGYSSRLKLLLHTGRPVFIAQRPWKEYYHAALQPLVHYIPVKEDLSDLMSQLDWADAHPEEAAAIGRAGQAFAQAT